MGDDADLTESLAARVHRAADEGTPLVIRGGGSKAFYGHTAIGEALDVGPHRGILNHDPTELILTARAGTPLAEVEALLAEHGQMLAFEPPRFAGGATLGGAVSAGLAGPRRPFAGAVRDHVLGVRLVDGRGTVQRFGGEVMKNVAGYDLSRLVVGALGTLGVLLNVSLKVLPRPEAERSVRLSVPPEDLHPVTEHALRSGIPVTGSAHDGEHAILRIAGAESAVDTGVRDLDGEPLDGTDFWQRLRDHRLAFFERGSETLWRIALPPGTTVPDLPGECMIDWRGQLVWLRSDDDPGEIRGRAVESGGHATRFRGGEERVPVFTPLSAPLQRLNQRIKSAMDPANILNRGRMAPEP